MGSKIGMAQRGGGPKISSFVLLGKYLYCVLLRKRMERSFFWSRIDIITYDLLEIVFYKTINFSRNDLKLFSVCDMSFKFAHALYRCLITSELLPDPFEYFFKKVTVIIRRGGRGGVNIFFGRYSPMPSAKSIHPPLKVLTIALILFYIQIFAFL